MKGIDDISRSRVYSVTLINLKVALSCWCWEPGGTGLHEVVVSPPSGEACQTFYGQKTHQHSGIEKAAEKSTHRYRRVR